jgi:hypothetical protein
MPEAPTHWPTDVTRFCQRLAERLAADHYEHPHAAALALAVRGRRGVTSDVMAGDLGIPLDLLEGVEAGQVPFDDLPAELVDAASALDGLELGRLLASEQVWRGYLREGAGEP